MSSAVDENDEEELNVPPRRSSSPELVMNIVGWLEKRENEFVLYLFIDVAGWHVDVRCVDIRQRTPKRTSNSARSLALCDVPGWATERKNKLQQKLVLRRVMACSGWLRRQRTRRRASIARSPLLRRRLTQTDGHRSPSIAFVGP